MTVNISGQVPGEQNNGLVDLEPQFIHERAPEPLVAVVVIERAALKFNDVKQEWSATVRFKHIEPLTQASDQKLARQLLETQYATRTGADSIATELDLPDEPEPDFDTPLEDQPLVEGDDEEGDEDPEERESESDEDSSEDGFEPPLDDEEGVR
jgi:hypothetical protein